MNSSHFDAEHEDPWGANTWASSSILGESAPTISPKYPEADSVKKTLLPSLSNEHDPLSDPQSLSPLLGSPQPVGNIWGEDNNPTALTGTAAPGFASPLDGASLIQPLNHPTGTVAPDGHENKMSEKEVAQYKSSLRNQFHPLTSDQISIKEIPEKEGLLFKHINYLLTHHIIIDGDASVKKITRRYSDFVWLLEILVKKYPFRAIPDLPPKKFSGSPQDTQFLQRRRRGLSRFINQLIKHPVLSKEPLVVVFLTVPTDLTSWRKQANVDLSIEFQGKKISKSFIVNWEKENITRWSQTEQSLRPLYEQWSKICILLDRYEKRRRLVAGDKTKFASLLQAFAATNISLYDSEAADTDIGVINANLEHISKTFTKEADVLTKEADNISLTHLEFFKTYQDYLASLIALFERYHTFGGNTIPQVSRHLEAAEQKLQSLNSKPDVKGSEVERVKSLILNDKQEIFSQVNRDWLIKQCLVHEYYTFQETQYIVTKAFQDWLADRLKYNDMHSEILTEVLKDIHNMPLYRSLG
ncbi:hypothetical protein BABINDRAFT_30855 [Babjeviella inositovora NRRL Y-12698]|uniref:Sorting nexin MVP1 n=1 Tax=Babjeviella inositovora NRRL Y-12698 TaxID=984486 RepID=A0A1E3QZT7_9ASCO|nr:uncharacterized protein BABINDRAFT_30855 [Babjeviella inositovora NRRL Y-12698]ODQ82592.1 hypothetical protein BABINDRAFT_30855 [Babjeviella inositovora NRRL Y-12698]